MYPRSNALFGNPIAPEPPYFRGIYECQSPIKIVCGARGMGMTEYALSSAVLACVSRSSKVLYVLPNKRELAPLYSSRVAPMLQGLGLNVAHNNGRVAQTVRIGKGELLLRSGLDEGVAYQQFRGLSPHTMVFDGLDRMNPKTFPFIKQWVSLGRVKGIVFMGGMSRGYTRGMYRLWRASDRRQWHVKCERCGSWQKLLINNLVEKWEGDRTARNFNHRADGTLFFACEDCGFPLNRAGEGKWIAEKPERETAGFLLSRAIDPTFSIKLLAGVFASSAPDVRRAGLNEWWGLPYASITAFDRFVLGRKDRRLWPPTAHRPRHRKHARQHGRKVIKTKMRSIDPDEVMLWLFFLKALINKGETYEQSC